jgi:hypothetical protein
VNDRLRRSLIYFGLVEDPDPPPPRDDDAPLTRREELAGGFAFLVAFGVLWVVAELIGVGLGTEVLIGGAILVVLLVIAAAFLPAADHTPAPPRSIAGQVAHDAYLIALVWFMLLTLSRVFGNHISTDDLLTVAAVIAALTATDAVRLVRGRRREADNRP